MKRVSAVAALLVIVTAAAAQSTKPADPTLYFRAKTNWKGREKSTDPTAKKSWPASAKVIERKGEKVTFNFWCAADEGRKGVQIEGTLDDSGEIKGRVTKLLPGDDWHETMVGQFFSGSVKDKTLVLNRKSHRGGTLKAELTLQGKDKD